MRPDQLRDLVGAAALDVVGDVVGLEIQRADHADDHREDAADQHVEEVVDARAAAPQAVEALQVEADRHDDGHERQHVEVLRQRRLALGDGEETGLEADEVGQHEGDDADRGVGQHVQRDEQTVVALYHRVPPGAASTSSTACAELGAEAGVTEALGVGADPGAVPRSAGGVGQGVGPGVDGVVGDEQAGLAVDDGLGGAAATERDDRTAGGLRLDRHDAEVFLARAAARRRRVR